ncbi:plasma-membrane choline transporter family protein [Nitzschia inconspicua]|uniref:Choline transporter-like protein n=1 Tax=Nitzschia inconspicua TaxID=303405 RepID=A0A9K3L1R0_9STRA|nr:plasma-membrane choline transporter family protein [Nitzschia inconspicua]
MSSPVVVQGTAVAPPTQQQQQPHTGATETEHQPAKTGCNDPIFALLFYCNLGAIVAVAILYGPGTFDTATNNSGTDFTGLIYAVLVTGVISFIFSGLGLAFLMQYPAFMIKVGLIFVVVMSLVWCVFAFLNGSIFAGVIGAVFFLIGVCYARAVWSRIPFAAINMVTAGTAIKANLGVTLFAYLFTAFEVAWVLLWSVAFAGTLDTTYTCENGVCQNPSYGFLFLLLLSFYFTQQVLQSCVHVTVAGTVGTWWVAPEESGFCSKGVRNSFIRTITTSFGSICFGSLLVAIVQALRALANEARSNGDAAIFACIAECILACLARILEYFNKWAYIYVGVYGYSYLQAGRSVFQLFADRGWDAVIADDLVGNALLLTSIIVGGLVGVLGIVLSASTAFFEEAGEAATGVAFFLGFIVGLSICSILLSTIASGVNTVIVMFADAPREFESNHPELSAKMRETWRQFYPGSV